MAKSKHAPALFEVINKQQEVQKQGRVPLPRWWKSRDVSAEQPASSEEAGGDDAKPEERPAAAPLPDQTVARQDSAPEPARTSPAPASRSERPRRMLTLAESDESTEENPPSRPIVSMREGRFELSLTPVNGAVVAGVLLLTIYVGFELGRSAGGSDSPRSTPLTSVSSEDHTSLADTRNQAPNGDVVNVGSNISRTTAPPKHIAPAGVGVGETPSPSPPPSVEQAPPTPVSGERIRGLNYVVLESFADSDREDAEHAQAWFQQAKGIGTTVERKGDRWQLITTRGFDWTSPQDKHDAEQLRDLVPRLGQEYKQAFAGKRQIRYLFKDAGIRKW